MVYMLGFASLFIYSGAVVDRWCYSPIVCRCPTTLPLHCARTLRTLWLVCPPICSLFSRDTLTDHDELHCMLPLTGWCCRGSVGYDS